MWYIDLSATTITPVAIPGFSRPVNAFFSSDGNTAYVLNCGSQCGAASLPRWLQFDMTAQTIKAMVDVGGATVGLLNGDTLYVAGYAGGSNGTFDAVDVSNMTRTTANSVLINDGQQWKMALNNNKLYIGAKTCSNTVTGCLSVVNVTSQPPVTPCPPLGPVTGLLSIPNRTVMYTIQGGAQHLRHHDQYADAFAGPGPAGGGQPRAYDSAADWSAERGGAGRAGVCVRGPDAGDAGGRRQTGHRACARPVLVRDVHPGVSVG